MPAVLNGYNVVGIAAEAFKSKTELTSIALPSSIVTIGSSAFQNCYSLTSVSMSSTQVTTINDYTFDACPISSIKLPSTATSIGAGAFRGNSAGSYIIIPSTVLNIGQGAFLNCSNLTIYAGAASKPANWHADWNNSNRPVFWSCTIQSGYVVSFVKSATSPSNTTATNGINNPTRSDYSFEGWYTNSSFSGDVYTTDFSSAPNGTLYAKWEDSSCVAEGTLITLADGTQVAVEELTGNEELLVWNMFTGEFGSAPILFIDSDEAAQYEVINLYFSDGTQVKVIDEHAFWDFNLSRYVFLDEDAAQYIGHSFNKQSMVDGEMVWTSVQLIDVEIQTEYTTAWSPVTFGYLCYYVNGMLSMPGATEGFINIFDVNSQTMMYDQTAYAEDIENFGLFTYEEFAEIIDIPEIVFNAFGGQYLKVSLGKNLITWETISALIARYSVFFEQM
jgi:uncharacterized repeat protein (TIGR02543 family)